MTGGAQWHEQRGTSGTATVCFTDLVGSTELMVALGDTAFDALRDEHFRRLEQAIFSRRGVPVKSTGDGILATFPSAVDALAAAVAIQQETERHARATGVPIAVRVGVAIGEVVFRDGDVFGTPVVEAARLVAAARPSQILCAALVRSMAGSRAGVSFTDMGSLTLKGLPDPLPVCGVDWEPSDDGTASVPLPSLLTGGRIFVARFAELDRLRQRWKEAAAGERRLVLLGGEPGVGKTRLAAELAQALQAEGGLVLAGRCDEDLGVPYQPFVEALRHYVSHTPAPRLGRYAGELCRLLPELPQLVGRLDEPLRSDPETERYRLFDAVAAWLGDVSGETPVLLVLDDLHWAAKPTVLLLRHVLRSDETLRLLIAATYRDTDIGRGDPLTEFLADVPRLDMVERLPVVGLDVPAVAAFLEQAAGHDLDEAGLELARTVWRETEGNAFFVAEVRRHLVESGALAEQGGRWALTAAFDDVGIPEGVRDVVGRRLSRLSADANQVLACASVVGLEFEPAVVERAGAFPEAVMISALEEATAARLVVEVPGPVPRNRFSHALVRATLYDELSATRRVALHRHVAESIEARFAGHLDEHLPALAHHWARAAAPAAETDRAIDYATRAGDRALAQLANDDAVTYYRQARDLLDLTGVPDEGGRRLKLSIALGEAQRRAGDSAFRETLLEAARTAQQRGDAEALTRAALANNRGFHSMAGRVDAERVTVLDAALTALPPDDSAWRARLLASVANELGWAPDHDRRLSAAAEALAVARRLGDPVTLAQVLILRWTALPRCDAAGLEEEIAELERLAVDLGDPTMACWAAIVGGMGAVTLGDRGRLDCAVEAGVERARQSGQPFLAWNMSMLLGCRDLLRGLFEDFEKAATDTFEIGRAAGIPDAGIVMGTQQFWLRADQGRWGEVVPALSRAVARPDHDPLTAAALAMALAELGQMSEARTVLEPLLADDFVNLPGNYSALYGLTLVAWACSRIGDVPASAVLYDHLLPYAGLVAHVGPAGSGPADHFLGLLAKTTGRFDEADSHFCDAAAISERLGAPIWLARTRRESAEML